jgi:hypothetical protein
MAKFSAYSKRKLKASAIIAGVIVPAISIYTEFSLNAIPTATVSLPVGYDGETAIDSIVEKQTNFFKFRTPISLWVSYDIDNEEVKEDDQDWIKSGLEGGVKVFEGYIAGFGYERSVSGLAFTVSVEHWLSDLASSSALSGAAHSSTPGDMQRSALLKRSGTSGQNNAVTGFKWVSDVLPEEITDLWEKGYKKIYTELCNSDALVGLDTSGDDGLKKNSSGLKALKRMYSSNAELIITPFPNVRQNVVEEIRNTTIDSLSGQTLWDNLITASATFMFAISPHVEDAEVFPFCPSVKHKTPYKEIYKSDITNISFSGDCPRAIRAVCLMYGTAVRTLPGQGVQDFITVGKYINEENPEMEGTVIYRNCPSWISNSITQGVPIKEIPTGSNPETSQGEIIYDALDIRNKYAKTIYGFEILRGRQGTITGPLRQDIGVGSYVRIELPESLHSESKGLYMKGIVLKVVSSLVAQSSQSSTTLTVGYLRMEDEKEIEMDSHPLYSTMWSGSSNLKMSPKS